jgi:alanyl-tRNA synthetase
MSSVNKKNSSAAIRSSFLQFFEEKGHSVIASSPLVPANDPTLLFTNAGMVQFKDVFLGADKRAYKRAVSSQRCVRAGGKHNDLDQVGYTARHHTFFEMLGNFSFGDYFKQEAIAYAWEYLTDTLGLDPQRLWVTVFEEDDEAAEIWLNDIGVSPDRLSRIGAKDNFWAMGDTGPCGPCTEIFYDHGPDVPGGPPGTPEEDGDRYIEIWNLVFMQFDRDASGTMNPLPKPCVDTGMGLERLAAILQGVHSNYEIDLFQALISVAAKLTGQTDLKQSSLNVIADHIRACAFLIVDGVLPANEGRGYVLRRIIRRAIRHGYKLGQKSLFFHEMVAPLAAEMGDAYPELRNKGEFVASVLKTEEQRFALTLDQGMGLLEASIKDLDGDTIPGEDVFRLYDTYGFPADLTADVCRERGLKVDMEGFRVAMEAQRARARAANAFAGEQHVDASILQTIAATEFLGYTHQQGVSAEVLAIIADNSAVESISAGQEATIILNQTPFYAESGGQVGDRGELIAGSLHFKVSDTQQLAGAYVGHQGQLGSGELSVGDVVTANVDSAHRSAVVLNHSGTHLLHAALREVLGEHVEQKGSLVDAARLRFDFSHYQPVTADELARIEQRVNQQIRANASGEAALMSYDEAVASGAMALFGEKYGDEVRVMRFGDFSVELCGGTHATRAGDIGLLRIVSEAGIASGVRRIEAVTGQGALDRVEQQQAQLNDAASILKSGPMEVADRLQQLMQRVRQLEKDLDVARAKMASSAGQDLAAEASEIAGVKLVAAHLEGIEPKELRETLDRLKDKLGSVVVVLATAGEQKVHLVAGVTNDLTERVHAGKLVNHVAGQVGGRGGGRADMAQAGGNDPGSLDVALASVSDWLESTLSD